MVRRIVFASVIVAAGGAVWAQAGGAPGGNGGNGPANDDDTTPDSRFVSEADEALASMQTSMQKGLDEVKKAREEKDALRLTCVNEPVTAMKGVLRVATDAVSDLKESVATQQSAQARREFRRVKKSKANMDNLLSEAQTCAGADSSVSSTSVTVTVDPDAIAIDPYYGSSDFFFDPATAVADGNTNGLGEDDNPILRPPPASGVF
jgi:hypothetical protein